TDVGLGLDEILGGGETIAKPAGSYLLEGAGAGGKALQTQTTEQLIARVAGEPGDAQSWLVTLGLDTPGIAEGDINLVAGGAARLLCDIEWGLGGARFSAQIDWRRCSFVV